MIQMNAEGIVGHWQEDMRNHGDTKECKSEKSKVKTETHPDLLNFWNLLNFLLPLRKPTLTVSSWPLAERQEKPQRHKGMQK